MAARDGPTVLVEAPRVDNVLDTTGAGDAFVGSLAFFLTNLPQLGMVESVRRSCGVAAGTVQRKGAQRSYPKEHDVPKEWLH